MEKKPKIVQLITKRKKSYFSIFTLSILFYNCANQGDSFQIELPSSE